jgi:hypothetical protein
MHGRIRPSRDGTLLLPPCCLGLVQFFQMPDAPPLAPNQQDLTAMIAAELVVAWKSLGGQADRLPVLAPGAALYDAFERQGADANLLAIIGSWGDTTDDAHVLQWLEAGTLAV